MILISNQIEKKLAFKIVNSLHLSAKYLINRSLFQNWQLITKQ
jgi:hypothetical protein